jgi:hypothetical protein
MKTLISKNVLIHLLLIPFYFLTKEEIAQIPDQKLDTLLLFVGLIVIAPITSNFIYKYKDAQTKQSLWGGTSQLFFQHS